MPWSAPKTDYASPDLLTYGEMNTVGEDLLHVYERIRVSVHRDKEQDGTLNIAATSTLTLGYVYLLSTYELDQANYVTSHANLRIRVARVLGSTLWTASAQSGNQSAIGVSVASSGTHVVEVYNTSASSTAFNYASAHLEFVKS